ncbi:DUF2927 domain-containing protein [Thioclava sp. GXIMD4216]|uniref:DUF2927 domain-containing protein n=1 Tax=Thioclava litoralis TaxID=3076557 RepID=A0ABZ1DXV6_9RHOB|nr:DUF2927 domain-containing protein [Thioclava sp. FTW29]
MPKSNFTKRVLAGLTAGTTAALLSGCTVDHPKVTPSARASTAAFAASHDDLSRQVAPRVSSSNMASNSQLATDFLELGFELESGRPLAQFTRFEGPISVVLTGKVPARAPSELGTLISRLQREAGIPISAKTGNSNRITVEFVPRREMRSLVPSVACFVTPNVTSWEEYRKTRRSAVSDWTRVKQRTRAAVFIPADVSAQELHDCLNEEISQGLGPLNDLYRIPDSVWNDDNFVSTLTRHDMTILRAWYDPALHSGMSQPEVMAALPAVLSRINPSGGQFSRVLSDPTPRSYEDAVNRAMASGGAGRRQAAARQAIQIAAAQGWTDTRMGFAWYLLGRLSPNDPNQALQAYLKASEYFAITPRAYMQTAHTDMQLATFALGSGRADQAIRLSTRGLQNSSASGNGKLAYELQTIRKQAQKTLGQSGGAMMAFAE